MKYFYTPEPVLLKTINGLLKNRATPLPADTFSFCCNIDHFIAHAVLLFCGGGRVCVALAAAGWLLSC